MIIIIVTAVKTSNLTTINTFTRQHIYRQTITMEMKTRIVQGGVCCPSHLAGTYVGQFRSQK
jgi:hypothetical protein